MAPLEPFLTSHHKLRDPNIWAMRESDMQRSAEDLLKTYLGERTGERVLAGRTNRGEGEKIHAVIWLCDLRGSTQLSESIPVEDFFRYLNEFFDCTAGAVLEHGGEILSYIGDAVLAIFAIGGTERPLREACFREEGACAAALAAARDARSRVDALNERRETRGEPRLEFGLALHVGDVMYGNLGIPQRMQFTVIGRALGSHLLGVPALLPGPDGVTWAPCHAWHRHARRDLHAD